jgi:AraC-like DNA-binding protein
MQLSVITSDGPRGAEDAQAPITDLHIRLLAAARATIEPSWWRGDRVEASCWRLYLAESPGVFVEIDGRVHPLPPRRLCFVPSVHSFSYWTEHTLDLVFAHFDLIGLPSVLLDELCAQPIILPELSEIETTFRRIENRQWYVTPDFTLSCAVKSVVFGGLSHWVESISAARLAELSERAKLLDSLMPAISLIEDRLGHRIANAELARACYMSEDHFIKLFHARVGQSPARYVRERTLDRAAERLLFSEHSIDSIAFSSGFSSRSSFSRAFTQRFGVPPGAYRNYKLSTSPLEAIREAV